MLGRKTIQRKAICTLDNGEKFRAVFTIKPQLGGASNEDMEQMLVKDFNDSQPNMVHKLKKVHLMRN